MQAGKQRIKPSFPEPFLDVITLLQKAIASPNDNILKRLGSAALVLLVPGKNFTIAAAPMQFGTSLPAQKQKGAKSPNLWYCTV
jgi:hypothetical protein